MSRAPSGDEFFDVAKLQQLDCAGHDQLGAADVEIVAAAAAQIHHLEAGLVLAVVQAEAAFFQSFEQRLVDFAAARGRHLIRALQHRIRKRRRQQVAIVERDAFGIDRVDALRLFQADHISLTALDDGDVRAVRLQLLRDVVTAGAGAEHQRLAAAPLLGVFEVAGMQLGAGEVGEPGQVGREGDAAHAGGENQMARMHDAPAAVGAAQRDGPLLALLVKAAADKLGAGPEIQLERIDVSLEPVRQHVLRDIDRPGRRERHVRQMINVNFVVQRQRVIALAPIVADARVAIDDQRVDADLLQPRGDAEPGLAAADDQHRRIAVAISALPRETVGPVLGAEVARRIGLAAALERFLMAADFVQVGVQRPGVKPALAVGLQAQRAVARADCGLEVEQRFDAVGTGARNPARRRAPRRNMEIRRLGARERLAQHGLDRRPAGHGLDIPGKGEHVAPEPVGEEQAGHGTGVAGLQRRFNGGEPVFGLGLRRPAWAILDNGHRETRQGAEMVRPRSGLSYFAQVRLDRAAAGDYFPAEPATPFARSEPSTTQPPSPSATCRARTSAPGSFRFCMSAAAPRPD